MYVTRYLDPEWNMAVYVKHGGVCQTTSSSSSNDQLQQLVALWRSREARGNHHALREKLAKAEQEASGQRLKAQQEIKAIREQFRAREEPAAPVKATPSPSPSAGAAVAKPPDATKSKDGDLAAKLAARRKWEGGDNGAANGGGGGGGGGGGDDDLAAKLAARRKWEGDGDGAPAAQSSSTSSSLKTAGDGTATMSKTAKRVVWRDSCIMEYELSAQEKQYKRSLLRFLEEEARLRKCQAARLRKRFFDYWRGSSVQQQQDGGEISPPPSPSLEAEQDEEVEVRLEEDEFEAASSMAEPDGGVPDGMGGSGEYWPPHFEDPDFGRLEDAEFGPLGDLDSIGIEDDLQLVEDAFVRIVRPRRE